VVIRAEVPHTIERVDVNAGHHARMSLTGFFQRYPVATG
jgi:hypothetical protein